VLIVLARVAVAVGVCLAAGCASSQVHGDVVGKPAVRVAPLTCRQQYETWKHGQAKVAIADLRAALSKVQEEGSADDIPLLGKALRGAGKASAALAAIPPPRCSDPAGYYAEMLARIKAAGDNVTSAKGLGGIILAEVPFKTVPGIERKLDAELNSTVGKHR
jgi:hypothetical protein